MFETYHLRSHKRGFSGITLEEAHRRYKSITKVIIARTRHDSILVNALLLDSIATRLRGISSDRAHDHVMEDLCAAPLQALFFRLITIQNLLHPIV
jgi:hypothetical protein